MKPAVGSIGEISQRGEVSVRVLGQGSRAAKQLAGPKVIGALGMSLLILTGCAAGCSNTAKVDDSDASISTPGVPDAESVRPGDAQTSTAVAQEVRLEDAIQLIGGQAKYEEIVSKQTELFRSGNMDVGMLRDLAEAIETGNGEFLASHDWTKADFQLLLKILVDPNLITIDLGEEQKKELRSFDRTNRSFYITRASRTARDINIVQISRVLELNLADTDPSQVVQATGPQGAPILLHGPIDSFAVTWGIGPPPSVPYDGSNVQETLRKYVEQAEKDKQLTTDPDIQAAIEDSTDALVRNTQLATKLQQENAG